MKGKQKTYLLVIVVLAVWAIVGVQLFSAFNPEEQLVVQNRQTRFDPKVFKVRDTFSIMNNYRDPFSGKLPPGQQRTKSGRPKPPAPKDSIVFPTIVYKGLVSASGGRDKIFALSVGGREILLSKGDVHGEVRLVKGNASGITVRYKGKNKSYAR